MLVIGQMAFTLVLLIGAGLFVQTLARLHAGTSGSRRGDLVMFGVNPPAIGYAERRCETASCATLFEGCRSLPVVESARRREHDLLQRRDAGTTT